MPENIQQLAAFFLFGEVTVGDIIAYYQKYQQTESPAKRHIEERRGQVSLAGNEQT